jgi:hypothetical protein
LQVLAPQLPFQLLGRGDVDERDPAPSIMLSSLRYGMIRTVN